MGGAVWWSNDTPTMGVGISTSSGLAVPHVVGGNDIYSRNPKDTLFFAGVQFPGVCALMASSEVVQLLLDKRKGKNVNGSRLAFLGTDPKGFDFQMKIWTSGHWTTFQSLLSKIWQPPTKKTQLAEAAAEIRHPILQALNVTQAALQGVFYGGPGPEVGTDLFRFHFQWSVLPVAAPIKTIKGAALGLTKRLPQLNAPANATPPAPWTDPKTTSLSGQPVRPNGGG